jgi:twinkle protein
MKLAKGYMSIITGYPSSGKSEFLDMLLVNLAVMPTGWKTLYYSPENHPIQQHMCKLAEKFIGKPQFEFTVNETRDSLEWLDSRFMWMYPEVPKLDIILGLAEEAFILEGFDAMVIDPWNEVLHDKSQGLTSDYLSEALMKVRRFGRKYDVHMFIVAHPKLPILDKNGCYPKPELYSISDGAMWRNKADYGWTAHRADLSKHEIEIHVQKCKYKWMMGPSRTLQAPVCFDYDTKSGRFKEKFDNEFRIPTNPDLLPF